MTFADGSVYSNDNARGQEDSIDPDVAVPYYASIGQQITPKELNLDNFLALHIMSVRTEYVSIRDLIANVGYVKGFLHAGKAKTPKDEELVKARSVTIDQFATGLLELQGVARVVLNGLRPSRGGGSRRLVHPCSRL